MKVSSSVFKRCLSIFSDHRRPESLAGQSSSILSTSLLAKFGAVSLVTASAGLGAAYAWHTGSHYGPLLGCLLVLFALGLEAIKPLSVSHALDAFRSWKLVQGVALAILGIVAISYSLTAELSLMAMSKGDLVAVRTSEASSATKANDKYDRAALTLMTMEPARPKAELDQKIAALLLTPGTNGCEKIDGR